MRIIKIDSYNLSVETNIIENKLSDINKGIQDVYECVQNMHNIWSGDDYEYFKNQMEKFLIEDLNGLVNFIESYNTTFKNYLKSYENLESEFSSINIANYN